MSLKASGLENEMFWQGTGWLVSQTIPAAITKLQRLGGLQQQKFTSLGSEGWKLKVRERLTWQKEEVNSLMTEKGTNPIMAHPPPIMVSSNPNHPTKAPFLNTVTWKVEFQHMDLAEMGGTQAFSP